MEIKWVGSGKVPVGDLDIGKAFCTDRERPDDVFVVHSRDKRDSRVAAISLQIGHLSTFDTCQRVIPVSIKRVDIAYDRS